MEDYAYMTQRISSWWRRRFRLRLLTTVILACAIANASPTKRLYVEPFTTESGSPTLREDVLSELRKIPSLSLVPAESDADLVLGGGGGVWIKGYRSLNPRSGRLPSDGTPVYDGYLSVELRDKKGETLWSYLATPSAGAADIPKDLAKRIVKHLAEAWDKGDLPFETTPLPQPAIVLKGAGATFPFPVYSKWLTNYRRANPLVDITYQPVGSEAGVHKLLAGEVDFGASESPDAIRELDPSQQANYLLFPSVVGAVVPVVNLPGLPNSIALTPQALAGIYLGTITKWNDPVLREANRGVRLPALDIVVVHRSDGSGTSYAWADYLSKTSPEWQNRVGASLTPKWPVGRGSTGNGGVAKLVKELGGSIGYVEFIYALQNHLSFAKVQNRNGDFVAASLEGIAVAANQSLGSDDDLKISIVDPPGRDAYPISTFTWFIIPARIAGDAKRKAITNFLEWTLGPGQRQAAALGYLPLPKDVIQREEAALRRIH
jgi:phosphate ABC transporter phosphate-binding protein